MVWSLNANVLEMPLFQETAWTRHRQSTWPLERQTAWSPPLLRSVPLPSTIAVRDMMRAQPLALPNPSRKKRTCKKWKTILPPSCLRWMLACIATLIALCFGAVSTKTISNDPSKVMASRRCPGTSQRTAHGCFDCTNLLRYVISAIFGADRHRAMGIMFLQGETNDV